MVLCQRWLIGTQHLQLVVSALDTVLGRFTGVHSDCGNFASYIKYKGRNVFLGKYRDEQQAAEIYDRARLYQASTFCIDDILLLLSKTGARICCLILLERLCEETALVV